MFDINEIYEPSNLKEALIMLDTYKEAKIIAGGTDVLIKLRGDAWEDISLISIEKLAELKTIKMNEIGEISIGAMVSFYGVASNSFIKEKIPMLGQACMTMGGPQIRNMATLGGNLANGAVSADSAPMLLALNARVKLCSLHNERIVPLEEFYIGPGKVVIQPGELLTEILVPKESQETLVGYYYKYAVRNAMDIANLSVASAFRVDENNIIQDMRISLGVAAPTPIRCKTAEEYAIGKPMTEETLDNVGELAVSCSKSRDSWRASKAYREHLITVLLKESCERALNEHIRTLNDHIKAVK